MRTEQDWTRALRNYLGFSLFLHFVWEVLQLPLYTIWSIEPAATQAFAVAHCTLGDTMIAVFSLVIALSILGCTEWPRSGSKQVWLATLLLGVGYTIYSEWLNVNVRGSWAYSPRMPTLPLIGTGVAPFLQWLVVPTLAQRFNFGHWPWRAVDVSLNVERELPP